ncbi:MAG: hypothetical protein LBQ66_02450 [Planctomycetaceae bacterium]|nr:hypothetical protein [Planctomycetaceae bacterium]
MSNATSQFFQKFSLHKLAQQKITPHKQAFRRGQISYIQAVGLYRSVENDVPTQTSIPQKCYHWASRRVAFLRNVITWFSAVSEGGLPRYILFILENSHSPSPSP